MKFFRRLWEFNVEANETFESQNPHSSYDQTEIKKQINDKIEKLEEKIDKKFEDMLERLQSSKKGKASAKMKAKNSSKPNEASTSNREEIEPSEGTSSLTPGEISYINFKLYKSFQ